MAIGPIVDGAMIPLQPSRGPVEFRAGTEPEFGGAMRAAPNGPPSLEGLEALRGVEGVDSPQAPELGFAHVLESVIAPANEKALSAANAAEEFAAGRRDDIHGTMLALSEADIELKFASNVRNKVVDAFYEIWRMNI
ncbi:MAG: flagellar hook-basal body complex protein FliE [Polyangiaceae bacterium]|nr:flagellar hook-basal body complex protein FliE [Polyangiaceae bacterium]MCB9605909.1 flagellar hook-basal body complex protein FliE [Polyangiaceae bacterium]